MGFKLNNPEHFNAVMAFASQDSKRLTNLISKLNYLLHYADPQEDRGPDYDNDYTEVVLSSDFAAYSFIFTVTRVGERLDDDGVFVERRVHHMSGGLIFDARDNAWSVNT